MTGDYEGPERRSAESMLARELVLVMRREDDLPSAPGQRAAVDVQHLPGDVAGGG